MGNSESTQYLAVGMACLLGGVALVLWSALFETPPCITSVCPVSVEAAVVLFPGFIALMVGVILFAKGLWRHRSIDLSDQVRTMGPDEVTTTESATPMVNPGLTYMYQRLPRT